MCHVILFFFNLKKTVSRGYIKWMLSLSIVMNILKIINMIYFKIEIPFLKF